MRFAKAIAIACILCFVAVVTSGCNTVRGMGKDIERAGEKVQNATHD